MNTAFGYHMNDGLYLYMLSDKEKDLLKACSDMAYHHWTILHTSYMNDIPKTNLHRFIHTQLKDVSEQLYFCVLKQINWNIHHRRSI